MSLAQNLEKSFKKKPEITDNPTPKIRTVIILK